VLAEAGNEAASSLYAASGGEASSARSVMFSFPLDPPEAP
jgi:hypothetical protein